jgi:hypothetical protein
MQEQMLKLCIAISGNAEQSKAAYFDQNPLSAVQKYKETTHRWKEVGHL